MMAVLETCICYMRSIVMSNWYLRIIKVGDPGVPLTTRTAHVVEVPADSTTMN